MASQPANAEINVLRRVRSYRQNIRHNSIKALVNRMRSLVMSVPNRETQVFPERDGEVIVTTSVDCQKKGLPVTVKLRPVLSYEEAIAGLKGSGVPTIEFPVTIGQDRFVNKTPANATDDLHQELRDVKDLGEFC